MQDDTVTHTDHDVRAAACELRTTLQGDVDDDTRRRAEYSSDASNYRACRPPCVSRRYRHDVVLIVRGRGADRHPAHGTRRRHLVAGNAMARAWWSTSAVT